MNKCATGQGKIITPCLIITCDKGVKPRFRKAFISAVQAANNPQFAVRLRFL